MEYQPIPCLHSGLSPGIKVSTRHGVPTNTMSSQWAQSRNQGDYNISIQGRSFLVIAERVREFFLPFLPFLLPQTSAILSRLFMA